MDLPRTGWDTGRSVAGRPVPLRHELLGLVDHSGRGHGPTESRKTPTLGRRGDLHDLASAASRSDQAAWRFRLPRTAMSKRLLVSSEKVRSPQALQRSCSTCSKRRDRPRTVSRMSSRTATTARFPQVGHLVGASLDEHRRDEDIENLLLGFSTDRSLCVDPRSCEIRAFGFSPARTRAAERERRVFLIAFALTTDSRIFSTARPSANLSTSAFSVNSTRRAITRRLIRVSASMRNDRHAAEAAEQTRRAAGDTD